MRANVPSSSIYVNLQKLHSLKRILYVAAHPDDENTRALAWFSLGEKAETAYFSLTRGDGGQNLIGDELGDALGVLRTQELLAARSYDGGKQFFSRALDFGYSKSSEESLQKWGEEELLSDLVFMIRRFRPDAIVTRFPPDERGGHGHHTASAMLAIKAFDLAADPSYVNKGLPTWQASSVYWNTSTWWVKDLEESVQDDERFLQFDIGSYNDALGMSYNEIGTLARSEHKCQGFGAIIERGSRIEYFEHLTGKILKNSFFENNTESWGVLVSKQFEKKFNALVNAFDFSVPSNNVPALLEILEGLNTIKNEYLRAEKTQRCLQIIQDCLGLHLEFSSADYSFHPGEETTWNFSALNRSSIGVEIDRVGIDNEIFQIDQMLSLDMVFEKELVKSIHCSYSNPYWLDNPHGDLFNLANDNMLLEAENDPIISVQVYTIIDGKEICFHVQPQFKERDPAYGERIRPMIAVPEIAFVEGEEIIISKIGEKTIVKRNVHSFEDSLFARIQLDLPAGWKSSQTSFDLNFNRKHEEQLIEFEIWPEEGAVSGELKFSTGNGEGVYRIQEIIYDHIPTQTLLKKSNVTCKALDVEINSGRVAYVNGVEDGVPAAIERLGFEVDQFEVSDLNEVDLTKYQSVVLGIRVYNVHPELRNLDEKLFAYVEQGGNLIMQYNTASRSAEENQYGPLSFSISRNRVTEEDATVTFELPEHKVLNTPNKISSDDFENWVQERGLYFASEWDEAYETPISWHDVNEDPQKGGLIIASYGKGQFMYSGVSFFRELPAGVIGAYRLFANMLSYTHE